MAQDNFMHSHPAEHRSTVLTCTAEVPPDTSSRSRPAQCPGSDGCFVAVLRRMLGGFVENVGQNEKTQQLYGSPGCVWSCVDVKLQETENTIAKCYLPRVYEKLLSDMKYEISSQAGLE